MVFFKRKEADAEPETAAARRARKRASQGDGVDPLDPLELAKQKARRRLIGAIALVLGAVVLLPMVFDAEPKNQNDDLSVNIPSQNSSFNPPAPAAAASSVPPAAPAAQSTLVPGAPVTPADAGRSVAPPVAAASSPSSNVAQQPPIAVAPVPQPRPLPVPVKPPVEPAAVKPAPPTSTVPPAGGHDDPRALAALEGKSVAPTSREEHEAGSFAVQIGAFSNADKVKEVRDKLQAAGLKPYTESLSTAQGPRTRVRVGPYSTHEAAEAAREKVKGLGFDGSVVTL